MERADTPIAANRSSRKTLGASLLIFAGALLVFSAALKFIAVPPVARQMAAAGFAGGKLTFLAVLEVSCAALFLWPRTRSIGILLVSAYLGGAICTHVQVGEYAKILPPAIILSLAWIGTSLRHPQMLWSLSAPLKLNSRSIDPARGFVPSRAG